MILDAVTKSITMVLGGAVTTNELDWESSWVDVTATPTAVPGDTDGTSNGAVAVTLVAAPAAATQRYPKHIVIYNKDTATATVTVSKVSAGGTRTVKKVALATLESMAWTPESDWQVFSSTGALKTTATAVGGSVDVQEGGASVVATATAMNFAAADFNVTDEGANVAGVAISGKAPSTATYLTLTSNAGLSAEVVQKEPFQARMQYDNGTQVSLQRYSGDLVVINGEAIDPGAGGIVLAPTDNLIANDGTDSGGAMAVTTLYYIYVSNTSASYAASDLRGSATAPSLVNGIYYLGAAGNALNWRFVGWVYTINNGGNANFADSVTQRYVVNYYNRRLARLFSCPAYNDNNAGTTWTETSLTYTPVNAGTGSRISFLGNGEDAAYVWAQMFVANGANATFVGIGIDSTTAASATSFNGGYSAGLQINAFWGYTPATGLRYCELLVAMTAITATLQADTPRRGSAADPYLTHIGAMVFV